MRASTPCGDNGLIKPTPLLALVAVTAPVLLAATLGACTRLPAGPSVVALTSAASPSSTPVVFQTASTCPCKPGTWHVVGRVQGAAPGGAATLHLSRSEWRAVYSAAAVGSGPFAFQVQLSGPSGGPMQTIVLTRPGSGSRYFWGSGDWRLLFSAQGASYALSVQEQP